MEKQFFTALVIGALTFSTAAGAEKRSSRTIEAESNVSSEPKRQIENAPATTQPIPTAHNTTETGQQATGVAPANKASSLLHMAVKNNQNQKLGEVKDVVIDLPSGKISYVVVGVGGFLRMGEKLVAVPPAAFTVSGTEKVLLLNADKAKLENAPGLDRDRWPAAENLDWGAAAKYWNLPAENDAAIRTQASVHSERNSAKAEVKAGARTDKDKSKELRQVDNDHNGKISGTAEISDGRLSASADARSKKETRNETMVEGRAGTGKVFSGQISVLDPEKRILTVKHGSTWKEFQLAPHPTLVISRNPNARLIDFKPGYYVSVAFREENDGSLVAQSVTQTEPQLGK